MKYTKKVNPLQNLWLTGTVIVLAVSGLVLTRQLLAASTGQLYLSPANQSVANGNDLVINVVVNTGGNAVSTVQSVLTYPSSKFSYVSMTPGAAFSTFPTPVVSAGSIQFTAGTVSPVTGIQTVATVTLKAINTGSSSVSLAAVCDPGNFAPTCSAAWDASTSENDLASVTGGTYTTTKAHGSRKPPKQ